MDRRRLERREGTIARRAWSRDIMGQYIPGNPMMLVQNMTGASSVIAANYVYGVANADGLTLVVPHGVLLKARHEAFRDRHGRWHIFPSVRFFSALPRVEDRSRFRID